MERSATNVTGRLSPIRHTVLIKYPVRLIYINRNGRQNLLLVGKELNISILVLLNCNMIIFDIKTNSG